MKILLAGQAFYEHNNGQAVFTINLAEGLAAAGHEVMVLAPARPGHSHRTEQQGVIVQAVPALPLGYNANITAFSDRQVAQIGAAFAPDVVHIQDHYFLSRSVLRMVRQQPIKHIGTNHFLPANLTDNFHLPRWLSAPVEDWLWRNMLEVYNHLDGVTTPTETGVAILKQAGLRAPVQAISCGVDAWQFRPRPQLDKAVMRRKYGLAVDKALLLYVGRLDAEKCLDLVIQALATLKRNDVQFAMAGVGRHSHELAALVRELGLVDQVCFTGFVPAADLPLLLNSADAFVMPSHAELQSIATLEAMASGLPVLAANACALPELVQPDVNGYLFAPYDSAALAGSITTLLHNRVRWADMGAASRVKVQVHTRAHTIQRYLDWYQEVRQTSPLLAPPHPIFQMHWAQPHG
ncbi:MAG: glycosyltransferase [Caldilineaceae bacterium]